MTKELQNLAWSRLPKEFKEEVKKMLYNKDFTDEQKTMIRLLFGDDNLTSDAEGEEMLTVSRKRVQEMYAHYDDICNDPNRPKDYIESVYEYADGVTMALDDLFGSKCLPENVATSEPNVDSLHANVDSLEPKFKYSVGDEVKYKSDGKVHKIGFIDKGLTSLPYQLKNGIWASESDLEPYTGPKENIAESRKTSQNCDKEFDNILKDSFSKERRLNVAAQIMSGILSNQRMLNNLAHGENTAEGVVRCVVSATILYTDTLIAGCEESQTGIYQTNSDNKKKNR